MYQGKKEITALLVRELKRATVPQSVGFGNCKGYVVIVVNHSPDHFEICCRVYSLWPDVCKSELFQLHRSDCSGSEGRRIYVP